MEIKDLINKLNEKYPLDLQEEWDNSGLQVGNVNNKLENILVSLDLEFESIKKAIDNNCNLIISHHPLLFDPIKSLDFDGDMRAKKLELLIKNDISLFSMHTNLDMAKDGLNDNLCEILSIKKEDNEQINYLRYGTIKKSRVIDFAQKVKEKLDASGLIIYGDSEKIIEKVAVCGGAGASFMEEVIEKDVDLFITADVKYHQACDAIEKGLIIIDPGHFASENHVIYKLEEVLKEITDKKILTYSKEDLFRKII